MIDEVNSKEDNKVFVGPRSKEEIDIIKSLSPDAKIVGIISDFDVRYNRYQITKKIKSKNKTLRERDIIEKSWGLTDTFIKQSDHLIINNGNLEKFYQAIDGIIKNTRYEQ